MGPEKEEDGGTVILKTEPVVSEVADIEATEPIVLEERMANEPEAVLPGKVSRRKSLAVGLVVPMPTLPLPCILICSAKEPALFIVLNVKAEVRV
jgi:hypothetical protein